MGQMNDTQLKSLVTTAKILYLFERDNIASSVLQVVIDSLKKPETKHETSTFAASGLWPEHAVTDANSVHSEFSSPPVLIVGSEVRSKLDEHIPVTKVKHSDFLLDNNIISELLEDTLMDQTKVLFSGEGKTITLTDVMVRREQ